MRHRKRRTKLSMKTSHRKATIQNMVKSLLKYQKIETTLRRAKEARRLAEHLISLGKSDNNASRRHVYSILTDRDLVARLFREIAPLFKEKTSGFTRIIPLGFRRGDGASLALLELTEKKMVEKKAKARKEKIGKAAEGLKAPEAKGEKAVETKKAEPKAKTITKTMPTLEEEKRAEKARSEDKKIGDKKNFLKNLRGFFRRKTDM